MSLGSLSRERWAVLEPLLDAALELDAARRGEFLDDACGPDTPLRAEVGALLAACEQGEGMLAMPAAVTYAPLLTEPIPTVLGDRYHLVREIARGGMATVFLADDRKHGRQVAVKVVHPELARMIGGERFAREIEIAAGLSHPHILPLHDSGEVPSEQLDEPSFLYSVSPFVAGESLRERLLRDDRLPPQEVVRLGRQIALALDYAHRQGVIHLDIKPGNILLHEGHAVIADFGIARAMSSARDDALARTLPLLGTPSYMSPEQAGGVPDIDGRSDVYSLGCVLYEMVVGDRPYPSGTSTAVLVGKHRRPPVDPARLHQYVSRELAAVILKAMSPSRDDRYLTAGDLARALSAANRGPSRVWRRFIVPAAAAVGIAAALLAIQLARRGTSLDANLVAVAPFDVESPFLSLWKEGLVDVLSRSLDGAGALRSVPASVVVRRWHGRADAQSAAALGTATGARLVIYGGLVTAGDSVRATAALLDVATGRTVAEFEERDLAARIDRLADSLTVAVLREIGRSRGVAIANATAAPTNSLTALKAYLQGEQYYRAARWDSAQFHFEHALAFDSTFAMAYHRLAAVRRWRDTRDIPDSVPYLIMRRTSEFSDALGPHERLLAQVDSLSAATYFTWLRTLRDGDDGELELLGDRLYGTLRDGIRRYPNDAELWFLLGEAKSRFERHVGAEEIDDRATLALYDHAIALDSTFAPAYVTPIMLSAYLDGAASARRYIHAYLSLAPSGPNAQIIRLADELLDPARAASMNVARLVDTLQSDALCRAAALLRHIPDPSELIVGFGQALIARQAGQTPGAPLPMCVFGATVDGLQFRGHLRDAWRLSTLSTSHGLTPRVRYNMGRIGITPADSVRAEFQKYLAMSPKIRITRLYGWWAYDGDTLPIRTYISAYAAAESRARSASIEALMRSQVAAGHAYLALARRDTTAALRQLLTTSDTVYLCWYENRTEIANLLMAVGRYRQAEARLERRWPGSTACGNGFDDVMWTLQRARVHERVGRREEAAADYRLVVDAWKTADPELQPFVRESRTALGRLAMSASPSRSRN